MDRLTEGNKHRLVGRTWGGTGCLCFPCWTMLLVRRSEAESSEFVLSGDTNELRQLSVSISSWFNVKGQTPPLQTPRTRLGDPVLMGELIN